MTRMTRMTRSVFPRSRKPDSPTPRDLPNMDAYDASRALSALWRLRQAGLAKVYTSAGSNDTRWQVWLEITARRVELSDWAREWLASQEPEGDDDDDAAND